MSEEELLIKYIHSKSYYKKALDLFYLNTFSRHSKIMSFLTLISVISFYFLSEVRVKDMSITLLLVLIFITLMTIYLVSGFIVYLISFLIKKYELTKIDGNLELEKEIVFSDRGITWEFINHLNYNDITFVKVANGELLIIGKRLKKSLPIVYIDGNNFQKVLPLLTNKIEVKKIKYLHRNY